MRTQLQRALLRSGYRVLEPVWSLSYRCGLRPRELPEATVAAIVSAVGKRAIRAWPRLAPSRRFRRGKGRSYCWTGARLAVPVRRVAIAGRMLAVRPRGVECRGHVATARRVSPADISRRRREYQLRREAFKPAPAARSPDSRRLRKSPLSSRRVNPTRSASRRSYATA